MAGLREAADAIGELDIFSDDDVVDSAEDETAEESAAATDEQTSDDETDGNESDAGSAEDEDSESSQVDEGDAGDAEAETDDEGDALASITTLDELTQVLEVDQDTMDGLQLTFNADGEQVTATLAELRRGYQRDAHFRRKTSEVAEQARQLETEKEQILQGVQRQLGVVGQFLQRGKEVLVGDMNSAEMQTLRQTDPGQWSARRADFQQRIQEVEQAFNAIGQQFEQVEQQQRTDFEKRMSDMQKAEHDKLLQVIPNWSEDVRTGLMKYLGTSLGFTSEELNGVYDHRLIVLADKARQFDAMKKAGKTTKKVIKKLPKVQKPAASQNAKKTSKTTALNKARARLRKSGKPRDAAAVLDHLLPEDY